MLPLEQVLEIREKRLDVGPFRTYSEVRLMKAELDRIVATDEPSWRVTISAVAGAGDATARPVTAATTS